MTRPTGRPRGRPKTKEYVTLMARVDVAQADEVKRYASMHRQPISVVIRDALTLLMDEYPFAGDRASPPRLAAHEFLSDRYESSLDTLVGETDSAGVDALLSDTNGAVVEAILSDASGEDEYASDINKDVTDITSDDNRGSAATHPSIPARARSRKMSDRKVIDDNASDMKADRPSIMSDTKKVLAEVSQRKGGRRRSPMGQRILDLLAAHPEGLRAEELRVYLKAAKPLGDTLQGMKRLGTVRTEGSRQTLRYFTAR